MTTVKRTSRAHVAHSSTTSVELGSIDGLATRPQPQTNTTQTTWEENTRAAITTGVPTKLIQRITLLSVFLRGSTGALSGGPKSLGMDFSS